jgi:hypothetical protein
MVIGDNAGAILRVTFHQHYLTSGSHYNSAVPVQEQTWSQ